jgi:3-isopropylmalate/(R)-2-methylmalate dehydratase small subunit
MLKIVEGKIIKYGDNINTDVIIPTKFCNSTDIKYLGEHCLANLDENFTKKCNVGDVLLVGENFGCGSSRENAPLAIKGAGVSCVIAKSFARIFYRNAINIGLPVIEDPDLYTKFEEGNLLKIDFEKGICTNSNNGNIYRIPEYPEDMLEIFEHGGLVQFIKDGGIE